MREDDDPAATPATPGRRGIFVSALIAAVVLPLLAAMLGPPFDSAERLSFLPGLGGDDATDDTTTDDATDDTTADDAGADDTSDDTTLAADGDEAARDDGESDGPSPTEHILRLRLCDGTTCTLEDGDVEAILAALSQDPEVMDHVHLSPEETYEWLTAEVEALADRIDADRIAGMLHVLLAVGTDPEQALARFEGLSGVSDVTWLTEGLSPDALLAERERFGFDDGRQEP